MTIATQQAAAAALDACLASQCESACGLGCGGVSQLADPDAAPSCESCISDNYCKAGEACATSPDCQTYMRCRNTCLTGDCIGACSIDHDAGVALYSTLLLALAGRCQQSCDVGGNWSCVGHVQWPTAKTDTRVLTVTFVNIVGGEPMAGVSVKMCGGADCSPPIDTGTSDANGTVHLTDTTSATNGQGYGLNGYLDVSGPNVYPALVYWGFPLSEGDALFGTPIPLFPADQWTTFTQGTISVDPTRGTIAAAALDCLGDQATGVSFSATGVGFDQETSVRYLQGTSISPTATHTDHAGIGFVFNVPTGSVDVTATPVGLGQVYSMNTVQVRQGTLTEVGMSPTPLMR